MPAAYKTFIGGATPGDLNVAANYSPAGVPVAGDHVLFNPTNPAENITANLTTGLKWGDCTIAPEYTGQFGNSVADPVVMGATRLTIKTAASKLFIKGAAAANDIDLCIVQEMNGTGTPECHLDGTINEIIINDGVAVTLEDTLVATTVSIEQEVGSVVAVTVKDATITAFTQRGVSSTVTCGITASAMAITTVNVYAGTFTHGAGSGTVTNVFLYGTGVYIWNSANTIAVLCAYGNSTFNATGNTSWRTLTTVVCNEGATINLDNGAPKSFTITTLTRRGGMIIPPKLSVMTIA